MFIYRITQKKVFVKFGKMLTHGPRKRPLDFAGNPDYVTRYVGIRWGTEQYIAILGYFTRRLFNGSNFTGSAPLAEACALPNAVLLFFSVLASYDRPD